MDMYVFVIFLKCISRLFVRELNETLFLRYYILYIVLGIVFFFSKDNNKKYNNDNYCLEIEIRRVELGKYKVWGWKKERRGEEYCFVWNFGFN